MPRSVTLPTVAGGQEGEGRERRIQKILLERQRDIDICNGRHPAQIFLLRGETYVIPGKTPSCADAGRGGWERARAASEGVNFFLPPPPPVAASSGQPPLRACPSLFTFLPLPSPLLLLPFPHSSSPILLLSVSLAVTHTHTHTFSGLLLGMVPGLWSGWRGGEGRGERAGGREEEERQQQHSALPPSLSRRVSQRLQAAESEEQEAARPPPLGAKK